MFNALRRIVSYLLIGVIIMTALSSLMLRLLTPMLGEYRVDIEQWASQLIQQPISIQSIDARIDGFTPKLNLVGVELLDSSRLFPIARFGELSIHFGMLHSLMSGRLTLDHIELYGLDILLVRDADGAVSVSGLGGVKSKPEDSQRPSKNEEKKAGLGFATWLLQQRKISIRKSHISWVDLQQQKNLDFPDSSITLQNSGNKHTIYGLFELPDELGKELEINVNLTGEVADRAGWHGDIYLRGKALNSNAMLKWSALKEWNLKQGVVDGEFWGDIVAGEISKIQGRFEANSIELEYLDKQLPLTRFDTQALIKRLDSGWQLQLSRINFGGALRGKMPRYLQLKMESDGWRINLDQLNLSAIPSLVTLIKPHLLDEGAQLRGYLRNIELFYHQGVDSFRGSLDRVGVSGIKDMPTVAGLTGQVELNKGVVSLAINSPRLKLDIPTLFNHQLPTLMVEGGLSASWDERQWQLWSHRLQLKNSDLNLSIATNLQSQFDQEPHIAIVADFEMARLNRLKNYLPEKILSKGVSGWLGNALHSGGVEDGKLLIYGTGSAIVEHSKGGRMEISLKPKGVDLLFHEDWPQIENIDAKLRFSGNKMIAHANKGKVLESGKVDDVTVTIESFKDPVLELDAGAHFGAKDGLRYISLSPLEKILGNLGETITAEGDIALKLHLGIPLGGEKSSAGKRATVAGELGFQKVDLEIVKMIKVNETVGVLGFNQSGVVDSKLRARLFEQPIKVAVYKKKQGAQESTIISAQGRIEPQKALADFEMPWMRQITGETGYKAVVKFDHFNSSAGVEISSDLRGMESQLPHPANKRAKALLPIEVNYQFAGKRKNQIDIKLKNRLSAQLKLSKSGGGLRDMHLHLGSDKINRLKYSGVLVTGRISQLDVGSWIKLFPASSPEEKGVGFDLPVRIDMQSLHLLDNRGEGDQAEEDEQTEKVGGGLEATQFPPLSVEINALKYGEVQLGGVVLVTRSVRNGVDIKKLIIADGNHRLTANGSWKNRSGTRIELNLKAEDTALMLKKLNFDTPLEEGKLSAEGGLSWPNSPFDFSLDKLDGSFKFKINDGVITDVDSSAGQMIGLFNVRKLINRMFLDFSDLKSKGLRYEELAGNFRISKGDLFTSDLYQRSLQADLLIAGRVGLFKQDYDLTLSIIPKISDALPVAGTLIWGPQVALALLTFRKLFGEDIDNASMQQYRITGNWDDPKIEESGSEPSDDTNE
ncbi:MAG: hypothetical protein GQ470_07405 [Gammaproteobacteria bacterium]|nr:hypothetical protein [Gammaproteobacteria bacterium]